MPQISIDNVYRDTVQEGQDLVLGLGLSGFSCVEFLARQGRDVRVADSRHQPPCAMQLRAQYPDIEVDFGEFEFSLLEGAQRLIVSPGISTAEPLVQEAMAQGLEVIGDIELFARVAPAPVIAVTGSNGKSTVTTWVDHVLTEAGFNCATGGNLGTPALQLLDKEIPDFYVLELSSFQLERTSSLHLRTAVVLNMGTDHVDHHGSIEKYHRAKWRITNHCEKLVVHADVLSDHEGDCTLLEGKTEIISYGRNSKYHLLYTSSEAKSQPDNWLCREQHKLIPTSVLRVVGYHNYLNALAVIAVAETCALTWTEIVSGLTTFTGLPHRMQWIGESRDVTWINDSKGTNVDATIAAIHSVGKPVILIAGGTGKGADFSALGKAVSHDEVNVKHVVLLGQDAQKLAVALESVVRVHHVIDMQAAVELAAQLAEAGDAVLLSPACASFDMFDGYQERGDAFVAAWRQLA